MGQLALSFLSESVAEAKDGRVRFRRRGPSVRPTRFRLSICREIIILRQKINFFPGLDVFLLVCDGTSWGGTGQCLCSLQRFHSSLWGPCADRSLVVVLVIEQRWTPPGSD
jgi:hypothetical protein